MRDAIDLSVAVIHNAPPDIASWPATHAIRRVELRNDDEPPDRRGLSFTFEPELPDAWRFFLEPSRSFDNFQYTVWVFVNVAGVWHGAGFIQMWQGRFATGAPLEAHWDDWAYDRGRWGPMVDANPKAGDTIALMVSAGNARGQDVVSSVRERSNVVLFTLQPNDTADVVYVPDMPDAPAEQPPTSEQPPTTSPRPPRDVDEDPQLAALIVVIDTLIQRIVDLSDVIVHLNQRIDVLESSRLPL